MNYILGVLCMLIILFLIDNYHKKNRLKKTRKQLVENWGKQTKTAHYNFFAIGKYFNNNAHKRKAFHILSEKNNIDFDIDAVFKFVDRTSSKIGQQYLYYKLRTVGTIEDLLRFDALTTIFENEKDLSVYCQLELAKLNSNNSYYLEDLINEEQLEKPKYIWLIWSLTFLAISSIVLILIYPLFGLLLIPILAVNMVFHYKNKHSVTYYLNGVHQLSRALKVSKKLSSNSKIAAHFKDTSFIKRIQTIQNKSEFIAFEKNISNEFLFAFWFLFEIIKILFNVEYLVFYSFLGAISKERKSIENMFLFIGEIDASISTASLKSGNLKICKPTFTDKNELSVKGIYHPLIENCVLNDVSLSQKSLLLTGSNMSGKTTFIRTVAINSILAQTLHICFADEYAAPFYKVYSSIRITDDLLKNTSYYLQEVLNIKELIEASNDKNPCLFVLDEIFKGTNTVERISGGKAILSYLNKDHHTVFVSTHDIELTDLLQKEKYELFHFSEHIENNKLLFDHKIKKGKLQTKNAIKILELYKYPSEIIEDAKNIESTYYS